MFGSGPAGLVIVSIPAAGRFIPDQQRPVRAIAIDHIPVAADPLTIELFVGVVERQLTLDILPALPARDTDRLGVVDIRH
jgi:hypothetical protein